MTRSDSGPIDRLPQGATSVLDYASGRTDAERESSSPPTTTTDRWWRWWVLPIGLAILGALLDPVRTLGLGTGSHAAVVLTQISGWCFVAAFASVPVLLVLRIVYWIGSLD